MSIVSTRSSTNRSGFETRPLSVEVKANSDESTSAQIYLPVSPSEELGALERAVDSTPTEFFRVREYSRRRDIPLSAVLRTGTVTLKDVVKAHIILQHLFPHYVVHKILHLAQYHAYVSRTTLSPLVISDEDVPMIALSVPADMCDVIYEVSVTIRGHDQGWSSYPEDKGTTRNSWTWYSLASREERNDGEQRLATNIHALSDTQEHTFTWNCNDEILKDLKQNKYISVWGHARFGGWTNTVEFAQLVISFYPTIPGITETEEDDDEEVEEIWVEETDYDEERDRGWMEESDNENEDWMEENDNHGDADEADDIEVGSEDLPGEFSYGVEESAEEPSYGKDGVVHQSI